MPSSLSNGYGAAQPEQRLDRADEVEDVSFECTLLILPKPLIDEPYLSTSYLLFI